MTRRFVVCSGFGEVTLSEGNESSSVKTEESVESFGKDAVNTSCHDSGAELSDTSMAEGKGSFCVF